jgi:hypothetical protein
MCPHTAIYVSAYCCISSVFILVEVWAGDVTGAGCVSRTL